MPSNYVRGGYHDDTQSPQIFLLTKSWSGYRIYLILELAEGEKLLPLKKKPPKKEQGQSYRPLKS